jgi:hypothetical protein
VAAVGMGIIFLLIWATNFSYGHSKPNDDDMRVHFAALSGPCQKVAGTMLKERLLKTQKTMTNQEIDAVIGLVDQERCAELNRQIDMIDRSVAPTTIIRDL